MVRRRSTSGQSDHVNIEENNKDQPTGQTNADCTPGAPVVKCLSDRDDERNKHPNGGNVVDQQPPNTRNKGKKTKQTGSSRESGCPQHLAPGAHGVGRRQQACTYKVGQTRPEEPADQCGDRSSDQSGNALSCTHAQAGCQARQDNNQHCGTGGRPIGFDLFIKGGVHQDRRPDSL
jgi:hypothetical protein